MNHVDIAVGLIRYINEWQDEAGDTPETNLASAILAQVHATLAVAEQQRISNLIALAGLQSDHDQDEFVRAEALYSLIQSVPHGMDDEHSEIRPDIARALKIGGGE